MARQRLVLETRSYRMRRMMDLLRVLPVVGLALWLVPLLWARPGEGTDPMTTGTALRYLFLVWGGLILVAFLLWRRTGDRAVEEMDRPDEPGEP